MAKLLYKYIRSGASGLMLVFLVLASCKQARKVADFIVEPTPRELYARQFVNDSIAFLEWENAFDKTFSDSLLIELPYVETGNFFPKNDLVYSYNLVLKKGEVFHAEVQTDTTDVTLFLDLYEKISDSLNQYDLNSRGESGQKFIEKTIEKSGIYKLILQPGIDIRASFQLRLFSTPLYAFPVTGKNNEAIQSFWGADRDGGRRSHQGVDIFADRGTPVIAVTNGRISSTGERGLGGKQVWLRSGVLGNSLYYAHLDSIAVGTGKRVEIGDTLGFVGNTGNARTTTPHLHFGIYEGYRGAIDPLPFIRLNDISDKNFEPITFESPKTTVAAQRANLRNSPTTEGAPIGETAMGDTLSILGITGKWAHVKTVTGRKAFVHLSLIASSP